MPAAIVALFAAGLLTLAPWSLGRAAETNARPFAVDGLVGTTNLSAPQLLMLASNGVVILPEDYRQIFDVYNDCPSPFYITADSVMQAFSLVLDDCIRKQERGRTAELLEDLAKMQAVIGALSTNAAVQSQQGEPDGKLFNEALHYLSGSVSIAGRLLDPAFPAGVEVREAVDKEMALVLASDAVATSPISGRTVDYSRFRAVGPYGGDAVSARFFRSVRYLQDTRLHVKSDRETLAGMILAIYVPSMFKESCGIDRLYWRVFGVPDDIDPYSYHSAIFTNRPEEFCGTNRDTTDPVRLVRYLKTAQRSLRKLPLPRIGSEVLRPEELLDWQERSQALCLITSAYLPDSELLFRGAWQSLPGRRPTGLDVGVMLGSRRASELLAIHESANVAARVHDDSLRVTRDGTALYARYLQVLQDYREELEASRVLQPIFQRPAWDDKTLNTLLCGWALVRHSACLAGKDDADYFGLFGHPFAGYVEPVPRFYLALADLLCGFENDLCAHEAMSMEPRATVLKLRAMEIVAFAEQMRGCGTNHAQAFLQRGGRHSQMAASLWHADLPEWEDWMGDSLQQYAAVAQRSLAGRGHTAEQNRASAAPHNATWEWPNLERSDEEILSETVDSAEDKSFVEYRLLINLCVRLTVIASKETRNQPLNEEDAEYIRNYGETLGNVCFYAGNSGHESRDDMPVVAPVAASVEPREVLMAGIGRAKCMKVVIRDPQTGTNVVCSGGITLYHEYLGRNRLTDEEWRKALKTPDGPQPVPWVARYVAPSEASRTKDEHTTTQASSR